MLPYPSPLKRIPQPVAITTNYDEQANTVTLRIIWDTPRIPLHRYNGEYFISEEPIEDIAALTEQQWAALAAPLPDSNAVGETSTEEISLPDIVTGHYACARVRVGRHNNWGEYGYLDYTVAVAGTGGGGGSGITDLISITDIYETLHEIDVVDGSIQTYKQTPADLATPSASSRK